MDRLTNYKIESATQVCRRACLGTLTPMTYYRLALELLHENPAWSDEEIVALRHRFLESLLDDEMQEPDPCATFH